MPRTPQHLRPRFGALILLAATAVTSCGDAPAPTAPSPAPLAVRSAATPAPARGVAATRRRLERAAAGLLYTSESDYPFDYLFFAARARAPLTEAAFRAAAGVPADSLAEERTLDEFLARHIERVDPADSVAVALVPRYRRLKRTLRSSLRGVRVFRVGRIAIRCYIVGVDAHGNIVGLATTAIET